MEERRITHILDYPFGNKDKESYLVLKLLNRCEDFRILKQESYSGEYTAEQFKSAVINEEYRFSSHTPEALMQLMKKGYGEIGYQRDYNIRELASSYKEITVVCLAGTGVFFPKIAIDREHIHKYYYLTISCSAKHPQVLQELDAFFSRNFKIIPREELIEDVLSAPAPEVRKFSMIFRSIHDENHSRDAIIAVFKKALGSTDPVVVEEAVTELWTDTRYKEGVYGRLLKPELLELAKHNRITELTDDSVAYLLHETIQAMDQDKEH